MVALGADVTAKDNGGETPLSWACLRGLNADVIEFLIKKGADVASIFPLSYRFPNRVLEILVHAGVEMPFLVCKFCPPSPVPPPFVPLLSLPPLTSFE